MTPDVFICNVTGIMSVTGVIDIGSIPTLYGSGNIGSERRHPILAPIQKWLPYLVFLLINY
jgi:hypothetical protein